jgi:hypothetical protein
MSTIIKLMEVVTETIIIIAWCQMVKSQNFIYLDRYLLREGKH